jgi:HlyD family secretion protein
MLTMNYETGFTRDRETVILEDDQAAQKARRRRIGIIVAVVAALIIGYLIWSSTQQAPAPAAGAGQGKQAATVSVIVPGRQQVDRIVSSTGNLAARREMPVGVPGEGGQIARVLVEPGSWVEAGQVLATIDRRVQTQQAASLDSQIAVAQADARLAQANLDRAQALVGRGFISKADLDRLTATRDAAAARVRVARATYQQALASNSRLDIRAPAAGLVLERRVEPGQVVSSGSGVLFRMARGGEMEVLARVGEADLAKLSVGQRAEVTPVGGTQSFAGQIWQISPVIDPDTRQGVARIALGYDRAIRPGGFATARIVAGSFNVPLLPESAVLNDANGSYVMMVNRQNRIERRPVKVGDVSDAGVTVVEGLSGTERIVQSAGAFVNPGEQVSPVLTKAR